MAIWDDTTTMTEHTNPKKARQWSDEREMSDAPVWFTSEEASAWMCGWDEAVRQCIAEQNAALKIESPETT